jgi:hypothetical protein
MLNAEGIYMLFRLGRQNEQLWLHVDLAKASDAAGELEKGLDAFEDAHVCEADFLRMMLAMKRMDRMYKTHLDKFQLRVLAQCVDGLGDPEHGADDVVARVSQIPQLLQRDHGVVDPCLVACLDHRLDLDGVRAVDHLEHIVSVDETETRCGRLQVVDGLSHVTFR